MMKAGVRNSLFSAAELLIGVAVLIVIILLSNKYLANVRYDATEHKIYSLSQGTKNILAELQSPIELKFFYSRQLAAEIPGVGVYGQRVSDVLNEYQRLAGDKIKLTRVDPEPFSSLEDEAVALGLSGAPIDQNGNVLYFGLAGSNAEGKQEIIAFFTPEREQQLEYDLTQFIYRLSNLTQGKVAVVSSLSVQGDPQAALYGLPSEPWFSLQQLDQLYELEYLPETVTSIDASIAVLIVIEPSSLSAPSLYALDQYALAGGRVILFIDPYAESSQTPDDLNLVLSSEGDKPAALAALLSSWGIQIDAQNVVADLSKSLRVQSNSAGRVEVVSYPVWFKLGNDNYDQAEPVLQGLGEIVLATAGTIQASPQASTTFTPLLTSSLKSSTINVESLKTLQNPKEIANLYQPGDGQYILAARVSGEVQTAYPNYQPPVASSAAEPSTEEQVTEKKTTPESSEAVDLPEQIQKGDLNAIVIADTDLLRDQFWVQVQNFLGSTIALPSAGNGQLIANMVDQMSGSADLISVRNQGSHIRPFTLLDQIRQTAEQRFLQKESSLIAELEATEARLLQLERAKNETNNALLTADQQAELDQFTGKKLDIRQQLREVRHALRSDIQAIETKVKVVNLVLMPVLVLIFGLIVWFIQARASRRMLVRP